MEDKLTKCSTGFRKSHGTQHSRLTILERGERAIGQGEYIFALFMDLSKPFDTINPSSAHYFLTFLKKRDQFCRTGLLHSSKLGHLGSKNLTCFIQILVQILMNLVLRSKTNRKWPKNG